MKVSIIATEHIRFAAFGSLHHIKVIRVAQWSVVRALEYDRLAYLLKELSVFVEFVLRKCMQLLQSRIPKHLDGLDNDFV